MAGSDFLESAKYFQITPRRTGSLNRATGIEVSQGTSNPPTIEKGIVVKVVFRIPRDAFDAVEAVVEIGPPNNQAIVDDLKEIREATA